MESNLFGEVHLERLNVKVKHQPFVYIIQGLFFTSNAIAETDFEKSKDLFERAVHSFELCLQSDPMNYTSLLNCAECYHKLAVLVCSKGRKMAEVRIDKENEFAISAEVKFVKALQVSPESPETHFLYARFLEKCGQYYKAEKEYLAALDRNPHSSRYLNGYSAFLRSQGLCRWAEKFERMC
jgi:tetratricopeptide (TPR) repeat protein